MTKKDQDLLAEERLFYLSTSTPSGITISCGYGTALALSSRSMVSHYLTFSKRSVRMIVLMVRPYLALWQTRGHAWSAPPSTLQSC